MGSRWQEHPSDEEQQEAVRLGLSGAPVGLEAGELALLRGAPDYDAEEMATVRPVGGWPGSRSTSVPLESLPASIWVPPSRIEPPARAAFPPPQAPARAALPPGGTIAPTGGRSRFPEERTVALMAEDLLGRPLDEPGPAAGVALAPGDAPRSAWSATDATDVWDSAMPLLVEG